MNLEKQRENFKNHIAKFTDYGNIKILDFKEPESSHYRIRFLFEEDYFRLHISGDLGELVATNYSNMTYWAKEVTFDYATSNAVRVDYMKFKPVNNTVSGIEKGDFYCYEVKSSVEDFHSKNGHNFIGDFNYYVMPEDVYEKVKDEIPYKVGVLVPEKKNYRGEWYDLKSVKKSARKDRERPVSEMLLMMFRSAARERNDK